MYIAVGGAAYHLGVARNVRIEAQFTKGYGPPQLIGHASEICKDGKERAIAALEASNVDLPPHRLLISLAPGDIRKDGSQLDLALAICLAQSASERSLVIQTQRWVFAAELGLNGELKPVQGTLAFVIAALAGKMDGIVLAESALEDLSFLRHLRLDGFEQLEIQGFKTLGEVISWMYGATHRQRWQCPVQSQALNGVDFDDMYLNPELQLIAMLVAAGGHSLLLRGNPGTGKSMFAARLASLLPKMSPQVHLECLQLHSASGQNLDAGILQGRAPARHPHHCSSASAILGNAERPGEISLAHGGLLFLDEFPEFRRDVIEGLREPLETGCVSVARAKHKVQWKARFQLIAACNPCPCGWYGSTKRHCRCSVNQLLAYRQRLSGPIIDRIDVHYEMPDAEWSHETVFQGMRTQPSLTEAMANKVADARAFADSHQRSAALNCWIASADLQEACRLSDRDFSLVMDMCQEASRRGVVRILRLARTIADLDQRDEVSIFDAKKALSWQPEVHARLRGEHLSGL